MSSNQGKNLQNLPFLEQAIFSLIEETELNFKEVGVILGRPESTIRERYALAKQQLPEEVANPSH